MVYEAVDFTGQGPVADYCGDDNYHLGNTFNVLIKSESEAL